MKKIKSLFRAAWDAVQPGPRATEGAAVGVLLAGGGVYLLFAASNIRGPLGPGLLVALALVGMGALLLFLGQGLAKALEFAAGVPWRLRWALTGGGLLIGVALLGVQPRAGLAVMAGLLASAALLGGSVAALLRTGWPCLTLPQRVLSLGGVVLGTLALMAGLGWYGIYGGFPEGGVMNAAKAGGMPLAKVALPDPSQPGPYAVQTLTYGSGSDRFRAEYGAGVAIKTRPVDGSKLLEGSWSGFSGQLRTLYWGFDPKNLPLNGRVWYPAGGRGGEKYSPKEKYPLVVCVHGNHLSSDFSDPGYAYLGELLASRGTIFVSVDENFLNSSPADFFKGFNGENDARGWLLLEHLRVWAGWNQDAASPFFERVDMDRIAVMGHSRGGEAAVVAAAFNRLPNLPEDGSLVFDYNFNIRAVVAIAPIDGQYTPAWRSTPLSDVNFLVLQGSHDSDVISFDGLDPYERVKFTDGGDWFKAAVYIYRANHGQFNSVWGDSDVGLLRGGFLNRAALISGDAQAQAARVYISAFLEAALRGQRGYLPLFQDARAAGEGWLPDTIYINRLDQAGDRLLAGYEDDINLRTTSLPGGTIDGKNLAGWYEQRVKTKWGAGENSAVYLAWNEAGAAEYTLNLPAEGFTAGARDRLIFNLADANQDKAPEKSGGPTIGAPAEQAMPAPDPAGAIPEEPRAARDAPRPPLDLTVLLEDAAGHTSALPLSRYLLVQPQLSARLYKAGLFEPAARAESIMQSYALPLADFVEVNAQFDPTRLRAIHFVFDRTKRGSVLLDAVGLRGR